MVPAPRNVVRIRIAMEMRCAMRRANAVEGAVVIVLGDNPKMRFAVGIG